VSSIFKYPLISSAYVESYRINRARQPRFAVGITDATFKAVVSYLDKLNYCGPLCLACDDTQLLPALRPIHDKVKDVYYLLGSDADEPILIADHKNFEAILQEGRIQKATKVCLHFNI
jgi:hypothetical protein